MTHPRQSIREAFKTAITGLSLTGSRVHETRSYPYQTGQLPALSVYTLEETSERLTMGSNGRLRRLLTVAVEVYVKASTTPDDTMDAICADIESAVQSNSALQALAKSITLTSGNFELIAEGEKPVVIGKLAFAVEYHTTIAGVALP